VVVPPHCVAQVSRVDEHDSRQVSSSHEATHVVFVESQLLTHVVVVLRL